MFNRFVKVIAAAVGCIVIAGSVAADDVEFVNQLKPPGNVMCQVFGLILMDVSTGLWMMASKAI